MSLPPGTYVPLAANPDLPTVPIPTDPFRLTGFVDAAYGTDTVSRRSCTGWVFTLCGGAIAYRSKLQTTTATSSTEAELIAAVNAAKTAKYLRAVMSDLGFAQVGPTPLYEDNEAAILIVNAGKPTARSRHIDIQHFAIQEWKRRGDIVMCHIPGIINIADNMTKANGYVLHQRHARRAMGHYGAPKATP